MALLMPWASVPIPPVSARTTRTITAAYSTRSWPCSSFSVLQITWLFAYSFKVALRISNLLLVVFLTRKGKGAAEGAIGAPFLKALEKCRGISGGSECVESRFSHVVLGFTH